jgi:hypothetical protein
MSCSTKGSEERKLKAQIWDASATTENSVEDAKAA